MTEKAGMFARIYEIASLVPEGRVTTYGQLALLAGRPRAARFVGFAMRCAPDTVPCHRVVNRAGTLAPGDIFGGSEIQRAMLEAEGVAFLADGRIDMRRCLWPGPGEA